MDTTSLDPTPDQHRQLRVAQETEKRARKAVERARAEYIAAQRRRRLRAWRIVVLALVLPVLVGVLAWLIATYPVQMLGSMIALLVFAIFNRPRGGWFPPRPRRAYRARGSRAHIRHQRKILTNAIATWEDAAILLMHAEQGMPMTEILPLSGMREWDNGETLRRVG